MTVEHHGGNVAIFFLTDCMYVRWFDIHIVYSPLKTLLDWPHGQAEQTAGLGVMSPICIFL